MSRRKRSRSRKRPQPTPPDRTSCRRRDARLPQDARDRIALEQLAHAYGFQPIRDPTAHCTGYYVRAHPVTRGDF